MSVHGRCPCERLGWGRRGAVLILVLIVSSALSLLAFGLCHRIRLELKIAQARSNEVRAYYLALGGIRRAMVALHEDEDKDVDHFGEAWRLNVSAAEEGFFESMSSQWRASHHLRYAVSDEEGRLNVNLSSPAGWVNLPGVTEQVVQSILDWQDADDSARLGGAESPDYLRQSEGYRAKNKPITMIWELARVKNVDWSLFVGEDANGNMVLDSESEDDGPSSWPIDNANGVLDLGLVDFFSVYGDGKVNLNTASEEVLAALPGIEREAAHGIVASRANPAGRPSALTDHCFRSFDDLATIPGVTGFQLELLEQYGRFRSQHFRVVSLARVLPGGTQCRLTGTVRRDESGVRLVLLRRD
jgi:type II secretory pathway component PulK